jgi:hypothetical protein
MEANEARIQQNAFLRLWNDFPESRGCLFHIANERASGSAREGAMLKGMGVVPGVPDLCLVWNGCVYWFEVKTATGVLSKAQKALHQKWSEQGVNVRVLRGEEEIYRSVSEILLTK